MMEAIWVALIASVITGTISPAIIIMLQNRAKREERTEDYARQDKVAAEAKMASQLLLQKQDELARQAAVASTVIAETSKITTNKLDVIHTLVNSNMTAAMQSELDATVRELAMMLEVIDLKKTAGKQPNPEALGAVVATKSKIEELTATLTDRLKQTKIVEDLQEKKMINDLKNEVEVTKLI